MKKGDGIMADKGFLIEKEIKATGLELNLPPFARSKWQMPAGDVLATKRIAKHRVHVERAIAKIKTFKIVLQKIPNSRLGISITFGMWRVFCQTFSLTFFRNK